MNKNQTIHQLKFITKKCWKIIDWLVNQTNENDKMAVRKCNLEMRCPSPISLDRCPPDPLASPHRCKGQVQFPADFADISCGEAGTTSTPKPINSNKKQAELLSSWSTTVQYRAWGSNRHIRQSESQFKSNRNNKKTNQVILGFS